MGCFETGFQYFFGFLQESKKSITIRKIAKTVTGGSDTGFRKKMLTGFTVHIQNRLGIQSANILVIFRSDTGTGF